MRAHPVVLVTSVLSMAMQMTPSAMPNEVHQCAHVCRQ